MENDFPHFSLHKMPDFRGIWGANGRRRLEQASLGSGRMGKKERIGEEGAGLSRQAGWRYNLVAPFHVARQACPRVARPNGLCRANKAATGLKLKYY